MRLRALALSLGGLGLLGHGGASSVSEEREGLLGGSWAVRGRVMSYRVPLRVL